MQFGNNKKRSEESQTFWEIEIENIFIGLLIRIHGGNEDFQKREYFWKSSSEDRKGWEAEGVTHSKTNHHFIGSRKEKDILQRSPRVERAIVRNRTLQKKWLGYSQVCEASIYTITTLPMWILPPFPLSPRDCGCTWCKCENLMESFRRTREASKLQT